MSADPSIQPDSAEPECLKKLLDEVQKLRPEADFDKIRRAFAVAEKAHAGQLRKSGEDYITHPAAVAKIVAELHMDDDSVCAALLHDVVEDTSVTSAQIEEQFGPSVREIVDGVTKLKLNLPIEANARERKAAETVRAAESMRKMLLAMAKDIRVMVIKLADRLHNMKTLDAMPPERRSGIANETLDVYAPLAARLGIWQIKWQLEDLSFKTLHPDEFRRIHELVAKTRADRDAELEQAMLLLRQRLAERGLKDAVVMGRSKHLYSIFNKVVKQGVPFEEIYDLTAVRIIVQEVYECYLALGIVHEAWLPIPSLFTDYIGMPKPNGYQSIHTKVIGPSGDPLEIQIRTQRMHEIAEFGVAAHWSYKEGKTKKEEPGQLEDLRKQLFDWSSDSRTSSDFLKTVSTDLFSEQVFVFTPKGDVLDLPLDSTPVDFAFRIHSDLGLKVHGAKVNGMMVPLSTKLQNGDVVEMLTRSNAQPSLDWLKFVKSAHAKSKIRTFLRNRSRAENAQRGREAVEKELRSQGLDPRAYLGEEKIAEIAGKVRNTIKPEDVFTRVGEGLTSVQSVVAKLKQLVSVPQAPDAPKIAVHKHFEPTVLTGNLDNVMTKRAKCCSPIPGDDVVGYTTRGRGIMIHRRVCPNLLRLMETEPERISPIDWQTDEKTSFSVGIRIVSVDRDGLLADITTILAENKTSVSGARIKTLPNQTAEIDLTISVRDFKQFLLLQSRISRLSDVLSILRLYGRGA